MKVVLLGPNGQLGTDIRRAHAAAGEPFDLLPVDRAQLDVTEPGAIERVLGDVTFDVLINCTSYHKTDEVEGQAGRAVAVNAHAVRDLAALCARKQARFVHVSTDYVFGGDVERREPLTENDPVAPVNVYGASKALGENLAMLSCEDTVILRVASLFGVAGASGKGGNFVETMIRMASERRELRVVNDQTMSPTSTWDIATWLLRLLNSEAPAGVYHAVNSGSATWYEFAVAALKQANFAAKVIPCLAEEFPTIANRPRFSALDSAKLSQVVGVPRSWQDALSHYLELKGHRAR